MGKNLSPSWSLFLRTGVQDWGLLPTWLPLLLPEWLHPIPQSCLAAGGKSGWRSCVECHHPQLLRVTGLEAGEDRGL